MNKRFFFMFLILGVNVKRASKVVKKQKAAKACNDTFAAFTMNCLCVTVISGRLSNNAAHPVIKGGKRSFRPFSHRDNDLLIWHGGNISGRIDTRPRWCGNVRQSQFHPGDWFPPLRGMRYYWQKDRFVQTLRQVPPDVLLPFCGL